MEVIVHEFRSETGPLSAVLVLRKKEELTRHCYWMFSPSLFSISTSTPVVAVRVLS